MIQTIEKRVGEIDDKIRNLLKQKNALTNWNMLCKLVNIIPNCDIKIVANGEDHIPVYECDLSTLLTDAEMTHARALIGSILTEAASQREDEYYEKY